MAGNVEVVARPPFAPNFVFLRTFFQVDLTRMLLRPAPVGAFLAFLLSGPWLDPVQIRFEYHPFWS